MASATDFQRSLIDPTQQQQFLERLRQKKIQEDLVDPQKQREFIETLRPEPARDFSPPPRVDIPEPQPTSSPSFEPLADFSPPPEPSPTEPTFGTRTDLAPAPSLPPGIMSSTLPPEPTPVPDVRETREDLADLSPEEKEKIKEAEPDVPPPEEPSQLQKDITPDAGIMGGTSEFMSPTKGFTQIEKTQEELEKEGRLGTELITLDAGEKALVPKKDPTLTREEAKIRAAVLPVIDKGKEIAGRGIETAFEPLTAAEEGLTKLEEKRFERDVSRLEEKFEEEGLSKELAREKALEEVSERKGIGFSDGVISLPGLFGGKLETEKELSEIRVSNEIEQEYSKRFNQAEKDLEKEFNRIQKKVDSGEITIEEAQGQLEGFTEKRQGTLNKNIQEFAEKRAGKEEKRLEDIVKKEGLKTTLAFRLPVSFALGAGVGMLPRGGQITAGTLFVGQAAKDLPDLKQVVAERDYLQLGMLGAEVGAFVAGARIGTRIGTKNIPQTRINRELANLRADTKIKAKNLDAIKFIENNFQTSPGVTAQLKNSIKRGFSVRLIDVKLRPSTTSASKAIKEGLIPDVRGQVLQVVNRQGKVVQSQDLGVWEATKKGKVYSRDTLTNAEGLIQKGKQKLIGTELIGEFMGSQPMFGSRLFGLGKIRGKNFRPIEQAKVLSETKLKERTKTPEGERLLLETQVGDISRFRFPDKIDFGIPGLKGRIRPRIRAIELAREIELRFGRKISQKKIQNKLKESKFGEASFEGQLELLRKSEGFRLTAERFTLGDNFAEIITGKKTTKEVGRGFSERPWTRRVRELEMRKKDPLTSLDKTFREQTKKQAIETKKLETKQFQQIKKQSQQLDKGLDTLTTGTAQASAKSIAREVAGLRTTQVSFPIVSPLSREKVIPTQRGDIIQTQDILQQQKTQQRQLSKVLGVQQFRPATAQRDLIIQQEGLLQGQKLDQRQIQAQLQETDLGLQQLTTTTLTPPDIKIPKIPIINIFPKTKPAEIKEDPQTGYFAFVKEKGKFRRVSKTPVTRKRAKSKGSYFTDHTTARTFKIRKAGRRAQDPSLNLPPRYWNYARHKHRDFRIIKGKKRPLKNKWIETEQHLIDTMGEIQGLKFSKALKQEQRKARQSAEFRQNYNRRLNKMFNLPGAQPKRPKRAKPKRATKQRRELVPGFHFNALIGYDPRLAI